MHLINLNLDKTKKYIQMMPGGEWHAKIYDIYGEHVRILVPTASADSLFALKIMVDALQRIKSVKRIDAIIPYLPGARQDRYGDGEALSCAVYADFINSCKLDTVFCIDPHSDVMPALINNCKVVPGIYAMFKHKELRSKIDDYHGFIAPDAGANKRTFNASVLFKKPMFQALKHRDMQTGKLSHFSCEELAGEKFLIVDDICDGGGTFIGLAKLLKEKHPYVKLDLWCTHSILSKDTDELSLYFDKLYTTDSHNGVHLTTDAYKNGYKFTSILELATLAFEMK